MLRPHRIAHSECLSQHIIWKGCKTTGKRFCSGQAAAYNVAETEFFPEFNKRLIIVLMPTWVLALNYWLHLSATVIWIGGLATLTLAAWPGLLSAAEDERSTYPLINAIEKRFRPLANISLIVLLITGFFQMSGDANYHGFFQIDNAWSVALFLKHIVYLLMLVIAGILQFSVQPALARARLLAAKGKQVGIEEEQMTQRRFRRLSTANLVLGVIVLLLTAVITAL